MFRFVQRSGTGIDVYFHPYTTPPPTCYRRSAVAKVGMEEGVGEVINRGTTRCLKKGRSEKTSFSQQTEPGKGGLEVNNVFGSGHMDTCSHT